MRVDLWRTSTRNLEHLEKSVKHLNDIQKIFIKILLFHIEIKSIV